MKSDQNYWNINPDAGKRDQWTNDPVVSEEVYRRISQGASSEHWLQWLFKIQLKNFKFNNILCPGCGTGDHEIIIKKLCPDSNIDAFDYSNTCINTAEEKAKKENLIINFYQDDLNTFKLDKKYDLIICSGSLHHVKELEHFYSTVYNHLNTEGLFIFNEYIGSCYTIYSEEHVDIINKVLNTLPQEAVLKTFENVTINNALNIDPSEAVRSSLIMPLIPNYFDIKYKSNMGGFLLHPIYPLLNKNYNLENIIKLLLLFEDILMAKKVFSPDFIFCICSKKLT